MTYSPRNFAGLLWFVAIAIAIVLFSHNRVSLADVFTPMKASALHAGMIWLPPLVFQSASRSQLPEYQRQLVERLKN